MTELPTSVRVVEVGPRDGLQNEKQAVPTQAKIELIERLAQAGLAVIETTSFVDPRRIPQLADAAEVLQGIERRPGVSYPVLVPNEQGMRRALAAGAHEVAVFTAASESFNRKNINASIDESIERFRPVAELAQQHDVPMRGYISCVLGCPYEGAIEAASVQRVAAQLAALGCYEISLGDTIGVGTPTGARRMLEAVSSVVPMAQLAVHFHDTRGQALANIYACLQSGISVIDASVSGLGGCPYAAGATGNVATEDLVYMLQGLGIETGIDLEDLLDAGAFINGVLGRQPASKLGRIPRNS